MNSGAKKNRSLRKHDQSMPIDPLSRSIRRACKKIKRPHGFEQEPDPLLSLINRFSIRLAVATSCLSSHVLIRRVEHVSGYTSRVDLHQPSGWSLAYRELHTDVANRNPTGGGSDGQTRFTQGRTREARKACFVPHTGRKGSSRAAHTRFDTQVVAGGMEVARTTPESHRTA